MRYRHQLACLLLLTSFMRAEGLLSQQPGTTIPANTWTKLTSTSPYIPKISGFDRSLYSPQTDSIWGLRAQGFRGQSTEPNYTWACWSFPQNRWDVCDNGGEWHTDTMPEGGHPTLTAIDQISGILYGQCCGTPGGQDEHQDWMWWYDTAAQAGRAKQTASSSSINVSAGQPTAIFDPVDGVLIMQGGDNSGVVGTSEYTPSTNSTVWNKTVSGTAPAANLNGSSMAWNSSDSKAYLIFGGDNGTKTNDVYRYYQPTATWEKLTVSGTKPSVRNSSGFAYNPAANYFLVQGGLDNAAGVLNDTWILDIAGTATGCGSPPCWVSITTLADPTTPLGGIHENLVYLADQDVFVAFLIGTNNLADVWAFRPFNTGVNAGTQSTTYSASAGSLNRNTGGSPTWARSGAMAVSGTTTLQAWDEISGPTDTADCSGLFKQYAQQIISHVVTALGTGCSGVSSNNLGSAESISFVGGVPWMAWYEMQTGGSGTSRVVAKGYSSGSWSLGGTLPKGSSGATPYTQGNPVVVQANSLPTIGYLEYVNDVGRPNHVYAFVSQWSGSAFGLLGGKLNVLTDTPPPGDCGTGCSEAESISLAVDGSGNPFAAWTEYVSTSAGSPARQAIAPTPQVELKHWNGSSWDVWCGGSGNITAGDYAIQVSATYLSQPYVAFLERTLTGNSRLVLRTCASQGGTWSTVVADLRRDTSNGWAYRPSLSTDGTDLYVTWVEQGNQIPWLTTQPSSFTQRPQVYVAKVTTSGTTTNLGGSLNADTSLGAPSQSSLVMLSGSPAVLWGEVVPGSLRQMYAKQWDGTDWIALGPSLNGGVMVGGRAKAGGNGIR